MRHRLDGDDGSLGHPGVVEHVPRRGNADALDGNAAISRRVVGQRRQDPAPHLQVSRGRDRVKIPHGEFHLDELPSPLHFQLRASRLVA